MSAIDALAEAFVAVLRDRDATAREAYEAGVALFEEVKNCDRATQDAALKIAMTGLDIGHPARAGEAAMMCGTLVERGATASLLATSLLTNAAKILTAAGRFWQVIGETMPVADDSVAAASQFYFDDRPVPESLIQRLGAEFPFECTAFFSLSNWCLPIISCISQSADLRRQASSTNLLELVVPLIDVDQSVDFLFLMLRVLDDEMIIVLHPEYRQGFECRICGIADNSQLHTLLAGELIRDVGRNDRQGLLSRLIGCKSEQTSIKRMSGDRPSAAVLATMRGDGPQQLPEPTSCVWVLHQWRDLKPTGVLPMESENVDGWLWYHGCPDDFEKFDGTRVVLLATPEYNRAWQTNRKFDDLRASVELVRQLRSSEVDDLLRRIIATRRQ